MRRSGAARRGWVCRRGLVVQWLAAVVATVGVVASAGAQTVTTVGPLGTTIREGTPRFTITTSGFTPAQLPLTLRLEVSLTADFAGPFWADTTIIGSSATIVIPRLLPQDVQIWWRTVATTAQRNPVVENATGPRRTSRWVTLLFPNGLTGNTLLTTRPTFQWSAVQLRPPLAPWRFRVNIIRTIGGITEFTAERSDSSYTSEIDLESNSSYRWALDAVAGTGDSIRIQSNATFVILSANAPRATVLFQPFPNPFPSELLNKTCVWFDIRKQTDVKLDVYDLRGNHVKKIFPSSEFQTFPPGRYGREVFGAPTGCDSRFTWDGTDDRGRIVRSGVYLIQFAGDGVSTSKRVLFRGR